MTFYIEKKCTSLFLKADFFNFHSYHSSNSAAKQFFSITIWGYTSVNCALNNFI